MTQPYYDPYNYTDLRFLFNQTTQVSHVHIVGWQLLILLLIIITSCQIAQLGISLYRLYRR